LPLLLDVVNEMRIRDILVVVLVEFLLLIFVHGSGRALLLWMLFLFFFTQKIVLHLNYFLFFHVKALW
jgi:hypothetical protein